MWSKQWFTCYKDTTRSVANIYIIKIWKLVLLHEVVELFLAKLMKFQGSLTLPLCPLHIAIAFPRTVVANQSYATVLSLFWMLRQQWESFTFSKYCFIFFAFLDGIKKLTWQVLFVNSTKFFGLNWKIMKRKVLILSTWKNSKYHPFTSLNNSRH